MFKVKWDAQNNGIILSDNISDEEAIPAPRPQPSFARPSAANKVVIIIILIFICC